MKNEKNENSSSCPHCGALIPVDAPQGLCPKCVMEGLVGMEQSPTPMVDTTDCPPIERLAEIFPNLEIIEMIGRGGMGFVYKARQPHLDRFVALKLLPEKLGEDPHFAERFNREARVLAKLNHPNIVAIYDFGKNHPFYFLLMEYVDGVNLRQAMRAGRFSPEEALSIVPRICQALQFAHEKNILHRDIKPENILLDGQGQVKIADFGIAKLAGEGSKSDVTLTMTGSTLGTPHYMAPEQIENPSEVDHRADIYSLGVVFYEMLTGELPIGKFEAPSTKTPMDRSVDEIVFRALERDRERRQKSAGQMKTEVETASSRNRSQSVDPTVELPRGSKPKSGIRKALSALLTGASLLSIGTPVLLVQITGASLGFIEILIFGLSGCICGLFGTILGWIGLSEIRDDPRKKGRLPLELFGALACPLALMVLLLFAVPLWVQRMETGLMGFSVFGWALLSVASIVLCSTTVMATCRWTAHRSLIKKWELISAACLTILVIFVLSPTHRVTSFRENPPIRSGRTLSNKERLPDGFVELVALSNHPSEGVWWKPDGSSWTGDTFENPGSRVGVRQGYKGIELVFKTKGFSVSDSGIQYELPDAVALAGGHLPLLEGQSTGSHVHLSTEFPSDLNQTTIMVGVADGPWQTLTQGVNHTHSSRTTIEGVSGKPVHVEMMGDIVDKDGNSVLNVIHDISEMQIRALAIDQDGEEYPNVRGTQSRTFLTAVFKEPKPEDIKEFRLEVRPYRWAVFENVSLQPLSEAFQKQSGSVSSLVGKERNRKE